MPDEPATPPPTPQPENNPPGQTPSPLNAAQLASLTKTEEICRVASKPAYLANLIELEPGEEPGEDDISEATITAVLDTCAQARGLSSDAAGATGDKKRASQAEDAAENALLEVIRFIQSRARQKHFFKNPSLLREDGIGENLDASRAILEQYTQTIYEKTETDKLPKVTAAKREELKQALQKYKDTQTEQAGTASTASQFRGSRNELLKAATAGRMSIQFAADAEWPHTDPANHPHRHGVPASREPRLCRVAAAKYYRPPLHVRRRGPGLIPRAYSGEPAGFGIGSVRAKRLSSVFRVSEAVPVLRTPERTCRSMP